MLQRLWQLWRRYVRWTASSEVSFAPGIGLVVIIPFTLLAILLLPNQPVHDPATLLRATLDDVFSIRANDTSGVEVHYCPDNTCTILSSPLATPDELAEYALVYMSFACDSIYLDTTNRYPIPPRSTLRLRAEAFVRSDPKSSTPLLEAAANYLRSRAETLQIELRFVRFDEGVRAEDTLPLDDDISLEALTRVAERSHAK